MHRIVKLPCFQPMCKWVFRKCELSITNKAVVIVPNFLVHQFLSKNSLYFYELCVGAQCLSTKISIGKNIALLNWPAFNRCVNESLGSVNYPLLIRQLSLFQTFWFISSSYSFYIYELCARAQCFSTKIFIGKCITLLNCPAFNRCVNESLGMLLLVLFQCCYCSKLFG